MDEDNFAEDIEEAAGDEPILAIKIIQDSWTFYDEDPRLIPTEYLDKALLWEKARPLLDYKYDTGYGGQDCHDITAWTPTRVLFVHEYDGSTCIRAVERMPKDWSG